MHVKPQLSLVVSVSNVHLHKLHIELQQQHSAAYMLDMPSLPPLRSVWAPAVPSLEAPPPLGYRSQDEGSRKPRIWGTRVRSARYSSDKTILADPVPMPTLHPSEAPAWQRNSQGKILTWQEKKTGKEVLEFWKSALVRKVTDFKCASNCWVLCCWALHVRSTARVSCARISVSETWSSSSSSFDCVLSPSESEQNTWKAQSKKDV